jgi:RNA recognition motif-containing protein
MNFLFFLKQTFLLSLIISQTKSMKTKLQSNLESSNKISKMNQSQIKSFSLDECNILTQGPICINNGDKIILPSNSPKNLKAHYSFDQSRGIDESGNGNNLIGEYLSGPAFGGLGQSALFKNGDFLETNNDNLIDVNSDFSLTFWLFLVDDYNSLSGERFCPFVQNGFSKEKKFAVYLDRQEKNLKIYINDKDILTSNSKFHTQKWFYVAIIKSNENLSLYVNGILDKTEIVSINDNNNNNNKKTLFIGNIPWLKEQCNFPHLIDEVKIYSSALEKDFIQAESSNILGGIEPNYLQIGCIDCTIDDAEKSCNEGYKLCTSLELHAGGYQIARGLGLIQWDTHIWAHSALDNKDDYKDLKGLGLCCVELK